MGRLEYRIKTACEMAGVEFVKGDQLIMGNIIEVEVNKLNFWLENFRFGQAENQDEALEKLIDTKNFNSLVRSINQYGFQSNNLLTVSKDREKPEEYVVYGGNRRLAAVKQNPEIKKLQVYEENDTGALNAILEREHNSRDPAGGLKWTSVQQARYEISLFKQKLKSDLSSPAECLLLLEKVIGKELEKDFPLTNFDRLYSSLGFSENFNINIDNTDVKVGKVSEVKKIYEDITDRSVNSRNTNTADNIKKYLESVLAGNKESGA